MRAPELTQGMRIAADRFARECERAGYGGMNCSTWAEGGEPLGISVYDRAEDVHHGWYHFEGEYHPSEIGR